MNGEQAVTDQLVWQASPHIDKGSCEGVLRHQTCEILVRNSNNRAAGHIAFTRAEFSAWLEGCKAGEFDDLG